MVRTSCTRSAVLTLSRSHGGRPTPPGCGTFMKSAARCRRHAAVQLAAVRQSRGPGSGSGLVPACAGCQRGGLDRRAGVLSPIVCVARGRVAWDDGVRAHRPLALNRLRQNVDCSGSHPGLALHSTYHAAQIVSLRKRLGAWTELARSQRAARSGASIRAALSAHIKRRSAARMKRSLAAFQSPESRIENRLHPDLVTFARCL